VLESESGSFSRGATLEVHHGDISVDHLLRFRMDLASCDANRDVTFRSSMELKLRRQAMTHRRRGLALDTLEVVVLMNS
jgi:hypothetical protein